MGLKKQKEKENCFYKGKTYFQQDKKREEDPFSKVLSSWTARDRFGLDLIWDNLVKCACSGSKTYFLARSREDSASFCLEKSRKIRKIVL